MAEEQAKISDDLIERHRARIGVKKVGVRNAFNTEATFDSIRHFAWGIGDPNPLWLDPDYAKATAHGGIIAPPLWLYSCYTGPLGPGSEAREDGGLLGLHTGDSWEFHEPVRLGDRISAERYLESVEELPSRHGARTIRSVNATCFLRQHVLVAVARSEIRTHGNRAAKNSGTSVDIKPWVYTAEELAKIAEHYASEKPRGAAPLDWKTVVPGAEIPVRLKGPLTLRSLITYLMGSGFPYCMTDRIAHAYIGLHPEANTPHPDTGVPDFRPCAHWDSDLHKVIGIPLGFDIGSQRVSWFSHLLTDWIGDDGRIARFKVELREPNWIGDTTWCRGRVLEANVINGKPQVKLELWGESQRGRIHTRGEALVTPGNVINLDVPAPS